MCFCLARVIVIGTRDYLKSSSLIQRKKWATSHFLEQYFVTVLNKYRLAPLRPLICLRVRTNCDVKRKR